MDFIGRYKLPDMSLCDDMIEFYKQSPNKRKALWHHDGRVTENPKTDTEISVDIRDSHPTIRRYAEALRGVVKKYIHEYPYCDMYAPWHIVEMFNIQHYAPGESYHTWHTERAYPFPPITFRHLVFMTYLNDVTDAGQTEFLYQKLKVKPVKGLTLIWPTDWTHTHRGIASKSQDKYITTGWFSFVNVEQQ